LFLSMKSISSDVMYRGDCWSCAKYLQLLFVSLGAEVRTVQSAKYSGLPCVLARIGRDPVLPTITFYAHYDVQPATKEDGWVSDPFILEGRNGYLYGRGVSDDKGPILAFIHAVLELLELNTLKVNIVFCIEGEGEHGSLVYHTM
jgi:di- and tripeptidase